MRLLAPAKINLHLRVGPAREDGFHPLLSWMVTVELFDTLELQTAPEPGIRLTCSDPSLLCDGSNLVVKVAAGVLARLSQAGQEGRTVGLSAALHKCIPVGAGLGGGSSDGAAALMGLDRLLALHWPIEQLNDLAARYGSDLPFFLHGPSSICTGRGEVVRPTRPPRASHAVLILPRIHVSTPAVYQTFDEMGLGTAQSVLDEPDWEAWAGVASEELLPLLVNDLEAPAFALVPELEGLCRRSAEAVGRIVRMSGSGSTLFTLFDSAEQAEHAAQRVQKVLGITAISAGICPRIPADPE